MVFLMKEHKRKNYIDYNKAVGLMNKPEEWDSYMNDWQEAYDIFSELDDFQDSKELAEECKILIFEKI